MMRQFEVVPAPEFTSIRRKGRRTENVKRFRAWPGGWRVSIRIASSARSPQFRAMEPDPHCGVPNNGAKLCR